MWAEVTLDYRDTERAAQFWSALLDVPARAQSRAGWFQLGPTVAGGPVINIQPVAEAKVGKSRTHLDFWVDDLASAIGLVEKLGGQARDEHREGPWIWRVMADAEGVEFCLVGGPADEA
ncbi:MAG: VOC family protein [Actinobacteria bacterium]|nr:VOC family protein [Actinomycetota bacterium]